MFSFKRGKIEYIIASAATKTGASKSGFAKWWASKTASVKAGVCAGTVAVTGAVGYAAVDYNSNYNKVVRAVDKLNDLSIYHLEFKESVSDEYAVINIILKTRVIRMNIMVPMVVMAYLLSIK